MKLCKSGIYFGLECRFTKPLSLLQMIMNATLEDTIVLNMHLVQILMQDLNVNVQNGSQVMATIVHVSMFISAPSQGLLCLVFLYGGIFLLM